MHVFLSIVACLLVLGVVLDAFQTIILPRRPTGRLRITRLFYMVTWLPWRAAADRVGDRRIRDQIFSVYGPLSLLLLLGLWAGLLLAGFALFYLAIGTPFSDPMNTTHAALANLRTTFYVSGTTLFTLGLGDVLPLTQLARRALVLESGTGLGFVALVIGYLPVLYQAFSRREVSVAMLDGRAGSPPTAAELLRRHGYPGGEVALITLLAEWERWAAELLESHVSYPLLCYYRSQHDNQSWIAALVSVLDACALLITTMEGEAVRQAQLTFAMGRHALVDLGHIFNFGTGQHAGTPDRLPPEDFRKLCDTLGEMHAPLCGDPAAMERLAAIRRLYEPNAQALCTYLRLSLPLWVGEARANDPWKKVADLSLGARTGEVAVDRVNLYVAAQALKDEEHL